MTEKWKAFEHKVGVFLASTVLGSFIKVALGGVLVWAINDIPNWTIPMWLNVMLVALFPVVVNTLNSYDTRYGRKQPEVAAGE